MINKTIHYCWFGGNKKPEIVEKCIQSWRKFCPDYDIKEWNESNWNINQYQYAAEAYKKEKWAFVSDVARLDIIFHFGGFYLDTDVELKDSLDKFCDYQGIFSFESQVAINLGMGFGAVPGHRYILEIFEEYKTAKFIKTNGK